MSGYRQSNFDPDAYQHPGAPLRPYNWVQWAGVAMGVIGLGLFLVHLAGKMGWIAPPVGYSAAGLVPLLAGSALINSRRSPSTLVTAEQRARNTRTLVITVALCAIVLGVAALIEFSGA